MISKELKHWLQQIEPMTPIQELYLKSCVMTGSYVFGGYDPETSDRDVLVPAHMNLSLFGPGYVAYESGKYSEEDFRSFYVKNREGVVFNILFFHTNEGYRKWRWATKKMLNERLNSQVDFSEKDYRVATFEHYKKLWKKYGYQ